MAILSYLRSKLPLNKFQINEFQLWFMLPMSTKLYNDSTRPRNKLISNWLTIGQTQKNHTCKLNTAIKCINPHVFSIIKWKARKNLSYGVRTDANLMAPVQTGDKIILPGQLQAIPQPTPCNPISSDKTSGIPIIPSLKARVIRHTQIFQIQTGESKTGDRG
jgi:hypothetical protein